MAAGPIIWLHPTGFGFIRPDAGERDISVHTAIFRTASITVPLAGQRLSFDEDEHKGRRAAVNLQII